MELAQFISQTLSEIQKGVESAICATKDTKGVINPCWGDANDIGQHHVQEVKFDIAVTVSDKTTSSAGGGINVVGLKVGADGAEETENSHISRIQFAIPIAPPVQTVKPSNSE